MGNGVTVQINGPLDQVLKILAGTTLPDTKGRAKVVAKNGVGRPKKKRKYTKKNAEYWAKKG